MEGSGSINLDWQPTPRVGFEVAIPFDPEQPFHNINEPIPIEIELPDIAGRGRGSVYRSHRRSTRHPDQTLYGPVIDELVVGNPCPTESILFHIPNFPHFLGQMITSDDGVASWGGRVSATTSAWRVEIDAVPHIGELNQLLAAGGGYGITHVGRLTRVDGEAVPFEDLSRIATMLDSWLSLLRSERTSPVLMAGLHEGEVLWKMWRTPHVARWKLRHSWLPEVLLGPEHGGKEVDLGPILESLDNMRNDIGFERIVPRAIDWYTQAVETNHNTTRIILAQAGLELMSWLNLVRESGISEESFDRFQAADALRIALRFASIDPSVPPSATSLVGATSRTGGSPEVDGPGAITGIRNSAIHPKGGQRFSDDQVIYEGGQIAIRYLELLILNRLGYMGATNSRVDRSGPEYVPWVNP